MTLLSDDLEENFDRFVVEAIEKGCVWSLEGPDGWALCASEHHPDTDVMPFWSDKTYAEIHCRDEWEGYKAVAIDLEEFLEDWLPGMHDDVVLVGINWNEELEGDEIEPIDLLEELDAEFSD